MVPSAITRPAGAVIVGIEEEEKHMRERVPVESVGRLLDDFATARIGRRTFISRGLALGLSIPALSVLIEACSSAATQAPAGSAAPAASASAMQSLIDAAKK
jgi:hypothetical protein